MEKKTTVLMILDGFGINERIEGNAIQQAHTPVLDHLMATYPYVKGYASGRAVGLPEGQMGNSEVGHLNIGAGRIVYQELTRITKAIEDGNFFENPALMQAMVHCKKNHSALHLYGLLSDGGVHSHNTHLSALLRMAKKNDLEQVFYTCVFGWQGYATYIRCRIYGAVGRKDAGDRRWNHCYRDGAVLCNGSRQTLGSNSTSL